MSASDTGVERRSKRAGRVALWLLAAVVVGMAVIGATEMNPFRGGPSTSLPSVVSRDMTHVGAWGRLAPRGEVRALAVPSLSEGARISKLNVVEGQRVSEGEVIAILDSHERRLAAVDHAKSMLALAEAKLDHVRQPAKPSEIVAQEALIAKFSFELSQSEADLRREESLSEKKISVESMLEQARLRFKQATQNKRQAEAQLESLKTPRPTDVAVAERQVDEARSALKQSEAELVLAEIRSPCNATVLRIHSRAGERVGDKGIISIGDVDQMYAIVEVYEADLARVAMGQTARVRIPTLKLEVSGTIERLGYLVQRKDVFNIDPVADTDARVVEVWVKLSPEIPPSVRQLSNARVEVMIDVASTPVQDSDKQSEKTLVPAESSNSALQPDDERITH